MTDYQLGDRVVFFRHLRRGHAPRRSELSNGRRAWLVHPDPFHTWDKPVRREGLVVGARTLANGDVSWYADEPVTFSPDERFKAYLVAYDLRRVPVFCLPSQLTPAEV